MVNFPKEFGHYHFNTVSVNILFFLPVCYYHGELRGKNLEIAHIIENAALLYRCGGVYAQVRESHPYIHESEFQRKADLHHKYYKKELSTQLNSETSPRGIHLWLNSIGVAGEHGGFAYVIQT